LATLSNDFVYDDEFQIEANPWIKNLSGVREAFSTNMWGFMSTRSNYYRPMVHVFYWVIHKAAGLDPWGYHLANILFHSASSVLVFLISLSLLRARFQEEKALSGALIGAGLFIFHPIHAEAVAWASAISEMSFSFFFLLSLYLWMKWRPGKYLFALGSALAFFISFLCKESAVMIPPVLLMYDLLFKRKENFLSRYFPLMAAVVFYLFLRVKGLDALLVPVALGKGQVELSGWGLLINIFPLFAVYLFKLLLPVKLSVVHLFYVKGLFEPAALVSIPVALLYGLAVWHAWRTKRQVVLFGLLFFLFTVLPALYLKGIAGNTWAERYLYLPSLSFSLIAGYFAVFLLEKRGRAILALVLPLALVLAFYAVSTIRRTSVWRDNISLWTDALKKSPDAGIAYVGLGASFLQAGRLAEAEEHLMRALVYLPEDHQLMNHLGLLYARKGDLQKSEGFLKRAIALEPGYAEAHTNLAITYADMGRLAEAVREFEEAGRLLPFFPSARFNLGLAYLDAGRPREAAIELREAVRLDPKDPEFHYNLSIALRQLGLPGEAEEETRAAEALRR